METIATMTGLGHQQAFSALLQQHAGIVFKVANTYARLPEDRADLAQEIATQPVPYTHPTLPTICSV